MFARSKSRARATGALLLLAGAAIATSGCSNKQRLPQYDFRDRTLAVVAIAPARPEIFGTAPSRGRSADSAEALLTLGSAIAVEVSARQARPRIDQAATNVNVRDRMSTRVLDGASRHLRAVPVASPTGADFEIEIRIERYGITATSWNTAAQFVLDAELMLLDGASGRRIWKDRVQATSPVRPLLASGDPAVDGAVTAIAIANMSTEEIQRHLEILADFSADRMLQELVRALDQTRR
jgi:hypothetical protein